MEIRVLRYFLALANAESISRAAEMLHVTQPTLSRQLMELEAQLGSKLFVRGSRKITLTAEGIFLRKRAEEILALVDKTETEFNKPDEIISGDIFIGGGETDAMRLIARAAKNLQTKYPHVHYNLFSGNAEDVTERLDNGLLDFGLLIGSTDIKKYDFIRLPAVDTWGVLMLKDSPLALKTTISPEDLWDIPLICSRQTMVSNELTGWLRRDFAKLNIVATYNLIYNASLMVEEGLGYALCLDKLINTSGHSTLVFKPLEPNLQTVLNIVWKKHQVFSKATDLFLKSVQAEFTSSKQ